MVLEIEAIEKALQLLGLEKCNYCGEWDRPGNFKNKPLVIGLDKRVCHNHKEEENERTI